MNDFTIPFLDKTKQSKANTIKGSFKRKKKETQTVLHHMMLQRKQATRR